VPPSFAPLRNFRIASGRLIEAPDLETFEPVCVLGSRVALELFDAGEDPVGQELVMDTLDPSVTSGSRGMRCRVVGVLAPKGQALWMDFDRYVLMPITTAQRRFRGDDAVDQIMFQVKDGHSPDRAAFEIDTLRRRRHRNTPDFRVRLQSEFRESMEQTLKVFQYFLGGIAGISLLVGGIGIANIMLIAVLERTREIGVRMALGARRRDILGQFLTEAMAIGGLGGLTGLLLGPGLGVGVARILSAAFERPWVSKLSPGASVGAFLFSLLVGVAAGLYPAMRASRLHPVEALRYE
jgi:putative ABC transport system permease protein